MTVATRLPGAVASAALAQSASRRSSLGAAEVSAEIINSAGEKCANVWVNKCPPAISKAGLGANFKPRKNLQSAIDYPDRRVRLRLFPGGGVAR